MAEGVEREGARCWQHAAERREQAHQIVVVEVEALVDELGVGEAEEEDERAHAVKAAARDAERREQEARVVNVHQHARPGTHERKRAVREVKGRFDEECRDPTVGHEARHGRGHHEPEQHAKRREGRDVHGCDEPFAQSFQRFGHARMPTAITRSRRFDGARHAPGPKP